MLRRLRRGSPFILRLFLLKGAAERASFRLSCSISARNRSFSANNLKQEKDRRKETISESSDGCLVSV
jgi:hypothetical protein